MEEKDDGTAEASSTETGALSELIFFSETYENGSLCTSLLIFVDYAFWGFM